MPTVVSKSSKAKITVTLNPLLVQQLDGLLHSHRAGSRSRLVEEAVREWLRGQAQRELERQTEEYYRSLSPTERTEDRKWSKVAARSAGRLWDK